MERMARLPRGNQKITVVHENAPALSRTLWTMLALLALSARLPAAFVIPNAEQDGYSYAEIIARWSGSLSSGNFRVSDLFGFWLPLFPFAAALPNLWLKNPLVVGKVLSALSGAVSSLLVFDITRRITRSVTLGWLAFGLVVVSPLHLVYSAACMTDIPHACLVLASVWLVLKKRWVGAAIFAALAECMRLESWTLILVLPLLQLVYERRISAVALLILVLPPLGWLSICHLATGDPFSFLAARVRYQASYMDFYPTRHGFALADIRQDADYLFLGANLGVVVGSIIAAGLILGGTVRRRRFPSLPFAALISYAVALFGFILISYVTKRQPVLFPRYGLIFFGLCLPLFMWLIRFAMQSMSRWPRWAGVAAMVICFWDMTRQYPIIPKVCADFDAHKQIVDTLTSVFQKPDIAEQRCFSDDVAVRVLSRLPPDRFIYSDPENRAKCTDSVLFDAYLRQQHVTYLVFTKTEDSLPAKLHPELGNKDEVDSDLFQRVAWAPSPFGSDIWLFHLRTGGAQ
jgi:hypothetical protein